MNDYEPLDLTYSFYSGKEIYANRDIPIPGEHIFHGLPFKLGTPENKGNICIKLDKNSPPINIDVKKFAQNIIFAHHIIPGSFGLNGLDQIEPTGNDIADYIFILSDKSEHIVNIRGRFEIASGPNILWTHNNRLGSALIPQVPFLAYPDLKNSLMDRDKGPWEDTGKRQMESIQGSAKWNYLWSWNNKEKSQKIDSIKIVPKGPAYIISAITLGYIDEYPFAKDANTPVKIETVKSNLRKNVDLTVEVDRGTSTYTYPLPESDSESFLKDDLKGWGESQNKTGNKVYSEISATKSATIKIKENGKIIDKVNWETLQKNNFVDGKNSTIQIVDTQKNWVKVKVIDADTNEQVPCRIHFRSTTGIPYQPHGHHSHLNSNQGTWHIDIGGDVRLGQVTYAIIDGKCEGWLPRGKVIVDVARGFEYEPIRTTVQIKPGQTDLLLKIKRWTNMNKERWYSGDSHVHFLSTQGAHKEAQSEDLNVVNLLQAQWGSLFTNIEDFTGEPNISKNKQNIIYVSQENRQHLLGHMILWGLKKPVMPWGTDGPGEGELGGPLETTLSHWADEAHKQGGYVISPHFPMPNGEPASLIATNRLDGIEMLRQTPLNHKHYYQYLNCGYKLPLVGGTDKMDGSVPVGAYRTYVYIPEEEDFTYENWCKNVSLGKTFMTGGPIIKFSIDGNQIGDTVNLSSAGTIEVEASIESIIPVHKLEIIKNGKVVASTNSNKGSRKLSIKEKIQIDSNSWLAARSGGPNYFDSINHHDIWERGIFAHTSPIYIACKGKWWMFDKSIANYMLKTIQGNLLYVKNTALHHTQGKVTHHHGEENHIEYLSRPLLEAEKKIKDRIKNSR